jgi:hypothetical protein
MQGPYWLIGSYLTGLCQGAVVGINSSAPLIAVDPMLVSIVKTYHSMHCDMLIPMMCGFLLSLIIHFFSSIVLANAWQGTWKPSFLFMRTQCTAKCKQAVGSLSGLQQACEQNRWEHIQRFQHWGTAACVVGTGFGELCKAGVRDEITEFRLFALGGQHE